MQIIVVKPPSRGHGLNIRQLLNFLYFTPVTQHPDGDRQRKARRNARDLRRARWEKQHQNSWIPNLPVVWTPKPLRSYDY